MATRFMEANVAFSALIESIVQKNYDGASIMEIRMSDIYCGSETGHLENHQTLRLKSGRRCRHACWI